MYNQILFITTTSLSANPRLLKELRLAKNNGFGVEVVCFRLGNWSDTTDMEHIKQLDDIKVTFLEAGKRPFAAWLMNTLIYKMAKVLSQYFKNSLKLNSYVHNKRSRQLIRYFSKKSNSFGLVVAHNLGALFPACQYSKRHHIPLAFDIEDYHPGETCSPTEKKRREFLMQKLLPKAAYISYASPLIGEYSIKLLNVNKIPHHFLVNNCFSKSEFKCIQNSSEKVQFVWFSQNIAAGRGLELVVPALYKFKDKLKLVLIGNLYQQFSNDFLSAYSEILQIQKPLPQADLNHMVCQYDVGLAIELRTADFNRDICLTNKIFTYAQAGLYLLATDTRAQAQFMEEHSDLGIKSVQTLEEIEKAIVHIIENIDRIREDKKNRFEYAKKLSWENEGGKLLEIWQNLLKA